jgi:hypothetical protein
MSLLDLGCFNWLLLGVASKQVEIARKELLDCVPGGLVLPDGNALLVT